MYLPQYREDTMVPVISTYETSTAEPAAVIQYIHGEDDEQSKEKVLTTKKPKSLLTAFKATKSKGKSKGKRVGDPIISLKQLPDYDDLVLLSIDLVLSISDTASLPLTVQSEPRELIGVWYAVQS